MTLALLRAPAKERRPTVNEVTLSHRCDLLSVTHVFRCHAQPRHRSSIAAQAAFAVLLMERSARPSTTCWRRYRQNLFRRIEFPGGTQHVGQLIAG